MASRFHANVESLFTPDLLRKYCSVRAQLVMALGQKMKQLLIKTETTHIFRAVCLCILCL